MNKITGVFRNVTWLAYLSVLIWFYAYMADAVTYRVDDPGNAPGIADKDTFFFAALGTFVLVNGACAAFISVLKKVRTAEDGRGIRNRSLKRDLIGWTKGFAGVLNVFLIITIIFIGYINLGENFRAERLGFFVYPGPLLLIAWFFYLMKLLGKKRE